MAGTIGMWRRSLKLLCCREQRICPRALQQCLALRSVHAAANDDADPLSADGAQIKLAKASKLVAQWCKLSRSLKRDRKTILDGLVRDTHVLLQHDKVSPSQAIRILVQCGWTRHQPPDLVDELCKFILLSMDSSRDELGMRDLDPVLGFKDLVEVLAALAQLKVRAHASESMVYAGNSHAQRLFDRVLDDIKERKWYEEKTESLLPLFCSVASWGPGAVEKHRVFLDQLMQMVTTSLCGYNARQLSRLIHSIGSIRSVAAHVIDHVVDELKKPIILSRVDPTGVSILVESLGKSTCLSALQFAEIVDCFLSPVVLEKMSTRSLCSLLKGLSYHDKGGTKWMITVLREAAIPPRLASMNPQDISGLLFACGRTSLCLEAMAIVDRIVVSFLDMELSEFANSVLVNIMHGIGLSKHKVDQTWIKLYEEADKPWRMESYTPREVAVLCWTMASTGIYQRDLFEKLVQLYSQTPQLQSRVETMEIGISQVLYSCAHIRHVNMLLFQELWTGMRSRGSLQLPGLAQLMWTLSVVGRLRKDQYDYFLQLLAKSTSRNQNASSQLDRYKSEVELYMMAKKSTSGSDVQRHISTARFGYEVVETPNKYVDDIRICLGKVYSGGWLVRIKNLVLGFVFPTSRNALLIPLKSADYALDLSENSLILRGPYASKIENLEKIGYKVAYIEQHEWEKTSENDRLEVVCRCLDSIDVLPAPNCNPTGRVG